MTISRESIERAFERTVRFGFRELRPGCVQIRTPFTYPDGDVIDMFVVENRDVMRVTDMGETLRYLGTRGSCSDISGVVPRNGRVLFEGDELYQEVVAPEEVPEAVLELVEIIEEICGRGLN